MNTSIQRAEFNPTANDSSGVDTARGAGTYYITGPDTPSFNR